MQLRIKLILMAAIPVGVALICMGITVRHQTMALANEERALVESAYLHSKEAELRQYVELALSTVLRFAGQPSGGAALSEAERQQQAVNAVAQLKFGDDGYFFLYDQRGNLLVNPGQMAVPNVDLCDPNQPAGQIPARLIVDTGLSGGGLVRYDWHKPSSQATVAKLGYVLQVPGWNWVIGTGLYLDDVEQALRRLDERAKQNIAATQQRIYWIAAVCMVLIAAAGVLLNLKDHRISSAKLRRLAQRVVHSQEEERARLARDLHDGVVQVLVSSKFLLETAQLQHTQQASPQQPPVNAALDKGLARLNDALVEIRRVSHGLRPALLDDLGLPAALSLMCEQMGDGAQGTGIAVHFEQTGDALPIPNTHATALYRVAQEAVKNACMHASGASTVVVLLQYVPRMMTLVVQDNGPGFDIHRILSDGSSGIGLRNMRERVDALGGQFQIVSSRVGTRIIATLPLRADAEIDRDAVQPHSRFDSSYAPA
ncbi:cache domain-containing protein [Diaphorobacter aerolatus]|uniref:Cache domain-containing protein n=1 Tax=Diaphorobacter aerolatus TaxID=1288495 RepID=A0A7H0GMW0_9BURK|nr:cache domain-containing protein [Diaphorobacter aerolatus]QNP49626.1 cache domain-containing protein [Diaphorobacter aerolatus]